MTRICAVFNKFINLQPSLKSTMEGYYGSPDTPDWREVQAVLGLVSASPESQVREIWKAASADNIADRLSCANIEKAYSIASQVNDPYKAREEFGANLMKYDIMCLLGEKALIKAVVKKTGADGFAAGLFSEITVYYASRDLSRFIGRQNRVRTVPAALDLEEELYNITFQHAKKSIETLNKDHNWKKYVTQVVESLCR